MLPLLALIGIGLVGSLMLSSGSFEEEESNADPHATDSDNSQISEGVETVGSLEEFLAAGAEGEAASAPKVIEIDGVKFDYDFLKDRNFRFDDEDTSYLNGNIDEFQERAEHLFGGKGDDEIIGGHGDVLLGGSGSDTFTVSLGAEVHILDLKDDEILILEFDSIVPELTADENDDGVSIYANGTIVVHLKDQHDFDLERVKFRLAT